MKNNIKFPLLCLLLITSIQLANAQLVQDKIYVQNGICFVPQVEKKIGQIQFGPIDGVNPLMQDKKEFSVGLLDATRNSIKYTIYNKRFIAASFDEMNGIYRAGPTFVAIDSLDFSSLKEKRTSEYLSRTGRTYHAASHIVFLHGKDLRKAIVKNDFSRLVFDFAANENGLFVFIHENDELKVWKLLEKGQELLYLSSPIERIKKEKDNIGSQLILSGQVTGAINSISAFSINNELYVFIHDDGRLLHITTDNIEAIDTKLEKRKSFINYSLVIDRDENKVLLIPKSTIKPSQESFANILRLHGIEIILKK